MSEAELVVIACGDIAVKGWGSRERNTAALQQLDRVCRLAVRHGRRVQAFSLTAAGLPAHPLGLAFRGEAARLSKPDLWTDFNCDNLF